MSKIKFLVLLSVICLVFYYGYLLLDYSGAIERWIYFFEKDGVNALYSSRDIFWEEEKLEWEGGNIGIKLFGMGGARTVEMDHADTLLNYGIVGVIIVYSFLSFSCSKGFSVPKKKSIRQVCFWNGCFYTCSIMFRRSSFVFWTYGDSICTDECISV